MQTKIDTDDATMLVQMQHKQLEMLKELDRVCKKNKLQYCLSSGTCLGAVRHQGFIPWDDDIDVYMSWHDLDKLMNCRNEFNEQYFLQTYKTDPEFYSISARLCDSSTSCFLKDCVGKNINHGVFIDIYIYYPFPDNKLVALKYIWDSYMYRFLVARSTPQNHGLIARIGSKCIGALYSQKRRIKKIAKVEHEYRNNRGKRFVATYFGKDISLTKVIKYPKEWFDHPKYLQFEDMMVPCPGDPEAYCRLQYGDSYMELPPEDQRKPHHDFLYFSVDEPYTKYKGVYY